MRFGTGLQSRKTFRHHRFDPGEGGLEFVQRRADLGPEPGDLHLAGAADFGEAVEAVGQAGKLPLGDAACAADLVGNIARRVGDHRQIVAQPVHVAKRRFAGGADRLDLGAIAGDEVLEFAGMG